VIKTCAYFAALLAAKIYCSKAIVIEGAFGFGEWISSLKPASFTAKAVVGPKHAIRVLFCLNFGKFLNKDLYSRIHPKLGGKNYLL
jgi:hypothetical protein